MCNKSNKVYCGFSLLLLLNFGALSRSDKEVKVDTGEGIGACSCIPIMKYIIPMVIRLAEFDFKMPQTRIL